MMRHTVAHSTPRAEKYRSTPARRLDNTHDHFLRRASPRDGLSSLPMRTLLFHEIVANHVHDHHMEVLDAPGVGMGDLNIELGQQSQAAAVPARQRDRPAPHGIAVFPG